ncbi:MAG TPA: hypothetical protein VGH56_12885 [Solirubrobacteraceae bacterium]
MPATPLDTAYYAQRRRAWLADEDTRREYDQARREIELNADRCPESLGR